MRLDARIAPSGKRWEGAVRLLFGIAVIGGFCSLAWRSGMIRDVENPGAGAGTSSAFLPPIIIDAGHGGADGGTVGNGLIEKNLTLSIARRLRARLLDEGLPVVLTRDRDFTLPLRQRAELANKVQASLLVSIHCNAGGQGADGIETFFSLPKSIEAAQAVLRRFDVAPGDVFDDERQMLLADAVQEAICLETGARNRGTKNRPELAVTRYAECPAVLVECGFLSDAGEASKLASPAYQDRLISGIVAGIQRYLERCRTDPSYGIVHQRDSPPSTTQQVAGF